MTAPHQMPAPIARVDPTNIRPGMFLEVTRELILGPDFPFRAVTITLDSHYGPGRFAFFGANHPDAIKAVHEGRFDISVLNPAAILTMAKRGKGPFPGPMEVAVIATIPHFDQLGFAVAGRLGFSSLADIAESRYPLRVSVRGSIDACTELMVDRVLASYGFTLDDVRQWGGEVSYDQPMPDDRSRIGRLQQGHLDAIFDEGVILWADKLADAGAHFLPIDEPHMEVLTGEGFRPGVIAKDRYPSLAGDVATVDYSGWPIYCNARTDGDLVRRVCEALIARAGSIPWHIGDVSQSPLPIARMARDSPETPCDVPLHPAAAEVWRSHGYL